MAMTAQTKITALLIGTLTLSGCGLFQTGEKYAGHATYALKDQKLKRSSTLTRSVRREAPARYSDDAPYRNASAGNNEPEILCDENGVRVAFTSEAEHRDQHWAEHADEFGFISDARTFRGADARAVDGGALKTAYDD